MRAIRIRAGWTEPWPLICFECRGYMASSPDGLCDGCAYFNEHLPPGTFSAWRYAQALAKEGLMPFNWNSYNDAVADSAPTHPFIKADDKKRMADGGTIFDIVGVEYRDSEEKNGKTWPAQYVVKTNMPDGSPLGKISFGAGSIERRDLKFAEMHEHFENGSEPIKGCRLIVAFTTNYGNPSYDIVPAQAELK